MPTTAAWGLTYPAATGHTRIWEHIQTLATDVDADLTTLGAATWVNETVAGAVVSGVAAVETIFISTTFTADGVSRYRSVFSGQWQATVADVFALFRLRAAVGATVTTAGTLLRTQGFGVPIASKSTPVYLSKSWIPAAGQTTVGFFFVRSAGSGTIQVDGGANADSTLEVMRLRA